MTTVAVQIPTFMEREHLRPTLEMWASQEVPDRHDLALQVWVTPETPRLEDDPSVAVAREFAGVTVHEAPQGKLSARNHAHDHAVSRGYDALVTTDADVLLAHDRVFAHLADAIAEPGVVGVNSHVRTTGGIVGPVATGISWLEERLRPHMNCQLAGFTADAWEAAGPLDESVDQTDLADTRQEEEFDFYHRLDAHGQIVKPEGVLVLEGARRVECHVQRPFARFGSPQSEWCAERGVSTFDWRERQQ